jgi:hypothetical protein
VHNHKSTQDDNVSIPDTIPLKNWGTTLKEIQHFVDYLSAILSAQRTEWSLVRLTGMTHYA